MGDKFHRWVIKRLHLSFERAHGWSFDGNEIQVEQFFADGLTLTFHPIDQNRGEASEEAGRVRTGARMKKIGRVGKRSGGWVAGKVARQRAREQAPESAFSAVSGGSLEIRCRLAG